MIEREGASVVRDTLAFAIAAQLQVETNVNQNMPPNQPKFEYYTLVLTEGKDNDVTSVLQIGDALNFVKVQKEHMSKSKMLTWLVTLRPIQDPSENEVSANLGTTSIQREMLFLSTGYEHQGMFFDIKVNQIGKIFSNFAEKIYEFERSNKQSSLLSSTGKRPDTVSS